MQPEQQRKPKGTTAPFSMPPTPTTPHTHKHTHISRLIRYAHVCRVLFRVIGWATGLLGVLVIGFSCR